MASDYPTPTFRSLSILAGLTGVTGTFTGLLSATAAGTGMAVTNNATVGGTLGVTGLITAAGGVTITGTNALRGSYGAGGITTNFAAGDGSFTVNTSGVNNVGIGASALLNNTTGNNNVGVGRVALTANTTGGANVGIGFSALQSNTTGSNNTAAGVSGLSSNTTGVGNTAAGRLALSDVRPTSKAITAFADYSGTVAGTVKATSVAHGLAGVSTKQITGTVNYNGAKSITVIDVDNFYFTATWVATETGWWAIASEGANNTAIGYNTGRGITTGSGNTILGANVTGLAAALTNNIILASSAGTIKARHDGTSWAITDAVAVTGALTGTTAAFTGAVSGAAGTFTGLISATAAGTGLAVTNNATVGGTLVITGALTASTGTFNGNTLTVGAGGAATIDFNHSGTSNWRFTLGGATSVYNFRAVTGGSIMRLNPTSAPVNYLGITSGNTGSNVLLAPAGSDTNVSLTLSAQGTGVINVTAPITGKFYHASPGSISWSGSDTGSATQNALYMTGVVHTGTTATTSYAALNTLNIAGTDNITAPNGVVVGMRMVHNVAAGATGTRNGLHYQLATTGASGAAGITFLTAANFFAIGAHNMGGTANSFAGALGSIFGFNTYARADVGATNTRGVVSYEANVSVRETTGTYSKVGIQIVPDAADAAPGLVTDAGLLVASQEGALGFRDAISIGTTQSQWSLAPTGITSVLRAFNGFNYLTRPPRAYWGVNLIAADIAGWSFASKGFSVDGNGRVQIGTGLIESTANGIKLHAPGAVGATVAVSAGGTNYAVNDIIYDSDGAGGTYGGIYGVATLAGSAVATLTIIKAPFVPGAIPANPIATTTWQHTGLGTGLTLTLTWTAGGDVTVGAAADKIGFYAKTPVALQTGVAVTAGGIHAALVNLGLITA